MGLTRPHPALGAYLRSPAVRRRKTEARALMHLGLLEFGARKRYRDLRALPAQLRALAEEFESIGPNLARELLVAA